MAAASKPDADGRHFINLFDVVTAAGIAVMPKNESDEALSQPWSNSNNTAGRAITFVERSGVLERGALIYFHDDEDDRNKITGSMARLRFTVPVTAVGLRFISNALPSAGCAGSHGADGTCARSTDR